MNKKLSLLILDLLAAGFFLYPAYFVIWANYDYDPMWSVNHQSMPLPLLFVVADILPCILGFCWLLFRYLEAVIKRFPVIRDYISTPKFHVPVLIVIVALVLIAKRYWR